MICRWMEVYPEKNGRYTSHHARSRKIFTVIPYHLII